MSRSFPLSKFGVKFTKESGVLNLMHDLGAALASGGDWIMLGGGNPASIPEMEAVFRDSMRRTLDTPGKFETLIGRYDAPGGNRELVDAIVSLLTREYGWPITAANVALTSGSQTSFFYLFNALAGRGEGGSHKKILLPLTPEYIGYADSGLEPDLFLSSRPEIELIGDDQFKYGVDFDAFQKQVTDEIAAICVSRPTNPTSNVLTEDELSRLNEIAADRGIPLIIDNAYGTPFPNIIFSESRPIWNENVILTMSLSKLGLAGVRTGIVIASEQVASAVASMNAIVSLAPGSFGAALARDMVASGEVLRLSREVIRPFYERKCARALQWLRRELGGKGYRVHKPEGTFFFWLWFEDLPITSLELYERLKKRGVLVVPGQYFFPGLDEAWRHKDECIRLNYSQDDGDLERGIVILGEVLARARGGG